MRRWEGAFLAAVASTLVACSGSSVPSPGATQAPAPAARSAPARSPVAPPTAAPPNAAPTTAAPTTASPPEGSSSATPNLYNATQAARGRSVFVETCSGCHDSSEFHDTQFQFKWGRRTVWDLYDNISLNMPDDDPGSLPPQQYIDVVAYILQLNGFPTGDAELVADQKALAAYTLAASKG
jgi:polar amino acid transport system substrate-binding protein